MKVRIAYTVDVDEPIRRYIRARQGKGGVATRGEVREYFTRAGARFTCKAGHTHVDMSTRNACDDDTARRSHGWRT